MFLFASWQPVVWGRGAGPSRAHERIVPTSRASVRFRCSNPATGISPFVSQTVGFGTRIHAARVHRQEGQLAWNDERRGYSFVQRRKHGIVRPCQLRQVAAGGPPPGLDPGRKPRDVVIAGDEPEGNHALLLESDQQRSRLRHGQSLLRSLRQNADEPQFRDRASEYFIARSLPETHQPPANALMELVFEEPQRNQCVHIQQISHGRLDRMSST